MAVFNPKMLDASIRDVVASLSNDQKTSVLLYAMERLPAGANSRTVIENGVQSCLQVSSMYQDKVIQARILRAKARFAAGLRGAAHQDLQAILLLDPNHREAKSLMPPAGGKMSIGDQTNRAHGPPRFSNEIWREIASFLPRRDLRSLLLVPHALSSIASQMLFKKVCLHFGTAQLDPTCNGGPEAASEIDQWHAQRSADILSRLVSDTTYANLVRSLTVWAPEDSKNVLTSFQIGMLANVLPKLGNLKVFSCTMGNDALVPLLGILEKSHPKLQALVIESTSSTPPPLPRLPRLNRFAYSGEGDEALNNIEGFLSTRTVALHTLVIRNCHRRYPTPFLSTSNLRILHLSLTVQDADFVSQLLAHGQQLQSLWLEVALERGCILSTAFRAHARPGTFLALRELSVVLLNAARDHADSDFFPAIAELVRGHPALTSLRLTNTLSLAGVGYDAAIWGALPSLVRLRALALDVPKDLSSALSAWLIPRGVVALDLRVPDDTTIAHLSQLCPGLPSGLKFLSLPFDLSDELQSLMRNGPPTLRVMLLRGHFYSVRRSEGEPEFERWSRRQRKFYFEDCLEHLNCEEAGFLYPRLPWGW
ncbi:hypothetical protein BC834DRAFT_1001800 [Gloeopeniophorella convolvens]|nr:hypothetical protein BC834DRAFT_1001800 [Gloeopeniophorella convolvens]